MTLHDNDQLSYLISLPYNHTEANLPTSESVKPQEEELNNTEIDDHMRISHTSVYRALV